MSVTSFHSSRTEPAGAGCGAAITPSSTRLGTPDVVVIVVVVLVLASLAATGRDIPQAMIVLVVAVADMVPRRSGATRRAS